MTAAILTRDDVRARARAAFEAGKSRDSHEMNWHAAALVDWLEEYNRLAFEARQVAKRREVETA